MSMPGAPRKAATALNSGSKLQVMAVFPRRSCSALASLKNTEWSGSQGGEVKKLETSNNSLPVRVPGDWSCSASICWARGRRRTRWPRPAGSCPPIEPGPAPPNPRPAPVGSAALYLRARGSGGTMSGSRPYDCSGPRSDHSLRERVECEVEVECDGRQTRRVVTPHSLCSSMPVPTMAERKAPLVEGDVGRYQVAPRVEGAEQEPALCEMEGEAQEHRRHRRVSPLRVDSSSARYPHPPKTPEDSNLAVVGLSGGERLVGRDVAVPRGRSHAVLDLAGVVDCVLPETRGHSSIGEHD
eukprot:1199686-Rhodomonas_salina.2